jgi:competence protein CoiA
MKLRIAHVDGERREPQPKLSGVCPLCAQPMIAKCGKIRIWHWAHLGKLIWDPWKEPKTEWHLNWQRKFPIDRQEVIHFAESGEKHIADVKTAHGWVLEFQHSHISLEERRARDEFYPKLAWIVDGTLRKRDLVQFFSALSVTKTLPANQLVGRICVVRQNESALLRDWEGCRAPVFLDFGENNEQVGSALWCLLPKAADGKSHVIEFSRVGFVQLHLSESTQADHFAEVLSVILGNQPSPRPPSPQPPHPRPSYRGLTAFDRHKRRVISRASRMGR